MKRISPEQKCYNAISFYYQSIVPIIRKEDICEERLEVALQQLDDISRHFEQAYKGLDSDLRFDAFSVNSAFKYLKECFQEEYDSQKNNPEKRTEIANFLDPHSFDLNSKLERLFIKEKFETVLEKYENVVIPAIRKMNYDTARDELAKINNSLKKMYHESKKDKELQQEYFGIILGIQQVSDSLEETVKNPIEIESAANYLCDLIKGKK